MPTGDVESGTIVEREQVFLNKSQALLWTLVATFTGFALWTLTNHLIGGLNEWIQFGIYAGIVVFLIVSWRMVTHCVLAVFRRWHPDWQCAEIEIAEVEKSPLVAASGKRRPNNKDVFATTTITTTTTTTPAAAHGNKSDVSARPLILARI